jgi:TRAP-type C4-dicarboxylate transport system substrate-binding protein
LFTEFEPRKGLVNLWNLKKMDTMLGIETMQTQVEHNDVWVVRFARILTPARQSRPASVKSGCRMLKASRRRAGRGCWENDVTFIATWIRASLAIVLLTGAVSAEEITLRLHQFLPSSESVPRDGIAPWARRIEDASNGRIRIELYPSMQLGGSSADLFDQAREGVVDLVWTVLGYTPGRFPKSEVFETPFMVTTAEATSRAFQRYVDQYALDEFEDVKLIAVHTHGPGLFHTRTPISSLEGIKDMKIRGGSRIISDMLAELGASPIGMPVPQVPDALARGVITGTAIPWQVTISLRTSELVHNHMEFSGPNGLYTQTFALVMNKDRYQSLPDDLKAIIDANSGIELAAIFGRAMDKDDVVGRQIALDLGNTVVTLDAAETERWKTAAHATIDKWIAATPDGQKLYDAAKALVAEESGL